MEENNNDIISLIHICKDENNNFQYNVRPNLYNNYDRTWDR